jgi:hypothetical protein
MSKASIAITIVALTMLSASCLWTVAKLIPIFSSTTANFEINEYNMPPQVKCKEWKISCSDATKTDVSSSWGAEAKTAF